MIKIDNIIAAHAYSPEIRKTVMEAKAGDPKATEKIARDLSLLIPARCRLVPVPSHHGQPTHTAAIALRMKFDFMQSLPEYLPAISGKKRTSQYVTKKNGGLLKEDDFGFHLDEHPRGPNKDIYIIEDIVGTGETVKAMTKLLPGATVVCYAIDLEAYKQQKMI